jgi:hypothetical protein
VDLVLSLGVKFGFLSSPCSTELRNLVLSLGYLVSSGRQVPLGGH